MRRECTIFEKFLYLMILIFPIVLNAQTFWAGSNAGTAENLNSIDFYDSMHGLAVGDNGTILRTYSGGTFWENVNSGTTQNLNGVSYLSSDCAVAVGNGASIFRSDDSGLTWIPITNGVYGNLLSIDLNESGFGVIGGTDQSILWTNDFGLTWTTVQTGYMGGGFEGAQILPDNTAFVFGSNSIFQPFVGRSTNSGASFSFYNFYFQQGAVYNEGKLFDGYFFDSTSGIAVGRRWDGQGCISTTTNLNSWTTLHYPTPFYGVDFFENIGCVVGANGTIYQSYDGGSNWVLEISGTTSTLNDVILLDEDLGYAVGDGGIILKKSDHQIEPLVLTADISEINNVVLEWELFPGQTAQVTHHNGYDNNGIGGPHNFQCAARFDSVELQDFYGVGELEWINLTLHSDTYDNVYIKVFEGGCYGDPGTEIYCEEITESVIPGEMLYHHIANPIPLIEGNEYWLGYEFQYAGDHPAAIDAGPMIPEKGAWIFAGITWDLLTNIAAILDYNWIIEGVITLPADNSRWLLGYNVYKDNFLLEYVDDPLTNSYIDESLAAGTYDYYVTQVYDEGESEPSNTETIEIVFPVPYNLNATMNPPNLIITWSFDSDQRDFVQFNLYLNGEFFSYTTTTFYVLNPYQLEPGSHLLTITAQFSGGFESEHSEPLEIWNPNSANNLPEMKTELFGNYPNPFNPSTTISFSLTTESTENTELIIYNLKGQKVRVFSNLQINQSTNQQITWDGTDDNNKTVSSGIYLYKLKAGEFEQSRKCLMLK